MSDYLTSNELAELVGCKPNQRALMRKWLSEQRWKYIEDRNKFPKVLRPYRDKKLGFSNGHENKLENAPNLKAFMHRSRRHAASV